MFSMFGNSGPASQGSVEVVFGDVTFTGGATSATTAVINQLIGKTLRTDCEVVATVTGTGSQYVEVDSLTSGRITFELSSAAGDDTHVMYHVFIV